MRLLITIISLFFIPADLLPSAFNCLLKGGDEDVKHTSQSIVLSSGQQRVAFAFLTDLHVSPGSVSESLLKNVVDEINLSDVDFTVVTGDLTNSGTDAELISVSETLKKLKKPCYVIPGNHETNWSESAGQTFFRLWGDDRFYFKLKGYEFVGFNTGPFMKMGDGFVKHEDLQWLSQQLDDDNLNDGTLISFSHYPLADGLDDWSPVVDLLKNEGCRISFCGHGHHLGVFNFDGIPGIMGRPLISGNSSPPGYNIVNLRNDSVLIFNKELSKVPGKPILAFNYIKADTLSSLPVSAKPDFSVNNLYSNRKVIAEWSDSASIFSGPCLVDDSLLVYGNSLGILKAISTNSKKIIWRNKIAGPVYSTPVASEGVLITGSVDGFINGMDAYTGKQLWKVKTGRPVVSEGTAQDGYVYIGGGDKSFYKIDIHSGKVAWQYSEVQGTIQGKPALSDSFVVFGAWDTYLYCLNKITGALNWKWSDGKPQKLYSPGNITPVCSGDKVFIVAPDRFMTAINIKSGKEVWRSNRYQVRESMGVSPDCLTVYAKTMNDTVIAISGADNFLKTIWAVNAGFGYEHNPCPVASTSGMVINGTRDGMLVVIDPMTSAVLWKYKAGNSSINKIVTDNNKILWFTLTEGRVIGMETINNQ